MRMYDLIRKKRDREELSADEINFIIEGFTSGIIPDYQMSTFLMAVYLNKMTEKETLDLTMAMAQSGDMLDLSQIQGIKVDKHSTGGVGDKTTLVTAPMVAALGVPVVKMSGRGLGHTGGTIDKLESFPGFHVNISEEEFIHNVNTAKIAIMSQTGNLVPADKKIYALRDVTATVDNMSLVASSIMSKKIAAGADVIVLDVKTGSGAFMKKEEDALQLAKEMVKIGKNVGRKTVAVISNMDEPLGFTIGNTLEVIEAIETLNGSGPEDLLEISLVLGAYMLLGAKIAEDEKSAKEMLMQTISDGTALKKLAQLVENQGGDPSYVFHTEYFKTAKIQQNILAPQDGYITHINAQELGMVSMLLGGGRETKESTIDLSVGIRLHKKTGSKVKKGDVLATLYANDEDRMRNARNQFSGIYQFSEHLLPKQDLIKHIIF